MEVAWCLAFVGSVTGGIFTGPQYPPTKSGLPGPADLNSLRVPDQTVPDQTVPDQTVPDQTVPDQTVPDQNAYLQNVAKITDWFNRENQLTEADLKDKLVLLYFWASWCAPCMTSVEHINKLHSDFAASGLVILGLSDQSVKQVGMVSAKFDYPIAAEVEATSLGLIIQAFPTAIIVLDGRIVYRAVAPEPKDLEKVIKKHLKSLPVAKGISGVTKGARSKSVGDKLAEIKKQDQMLSTGKFSRGEFEKFNTLLDKSPNKIDARTFRRLEDFYKDSLSPQHQDVELRNEVVKMIGLWGRKGGVPHVAFELLNKLAKEKEAPEPESKIRLTILVQLRGVSFWVKQFEREEAAKRLSERSDSDSAERAYRSYLLEVLPQNEPDAEPPLSVMLKLREEKPLDLTKESKIKFPGRPDIIISPQEIWLQLNSEQAVSAPHTAILMAYGFGERLEDGTGNLIPDALIRRDRALFMLGKLEVSKFAPAALEHAQNILANAILEESGHDWACDLFTVKALARLGTGHLSSDTITKLVVVLKEIEKNKNLTLPARTLRFGLEDHLRAQTLRLSSVKKN